MKRIIFSSTAIILLIGSSAVCQAAPAKTTKPLKKRIVQPAAAKRPAQLLQIKKTEVITVPATGLSAPAKLSISDAKSPDKELRVGATIFFRWQKYIQNGGTAVNNFDVDRAYIDLKKEMDRGAAGRLTLDISRISGAPRQNLFDYLKYAYVEMPLGTTNLKLGLQQTVWTDWADKMLNLRWIARSLVDNEGIMSSADFGVGTFGKLSFGGLPGIEYQATVTNGSGYATSEGDSKKAVAARLSSAIFNDPERGKILVGAFGNLEGADGSLSLAGNKQVGVAISYELGIGALAAEYLYGSKSEKRVNGYSFGGVLNLNAWLQNFRAFARIDNYDPDTSVTGNEKAKSFYGMVYDWGKDIKLAADIQNSQTGSGSLTSILYFHVLAQL